MNNFPLRLINDPMMRTVWTDCFSWCACVWFSVAPAGWCTSVRSPAANTQTRPSSNSPSRSGKSGSISSTESRERYRTRSESWRTVTAAAQIYLTAAFCPQCFLEMEKAEDAEKMAESCKANPPKFNGKRLTVYVSRKYRLLKHGWVSSPVVVWFSCLWCSRQMSTDSFYKIQWKHWKSVLCTLYKLKITVFSFYYSLNKGNGCVRLTLTRLHFEWVNSTSTACYMKPAAFYCLK